MKKLLFVNACPRANSRTLELARAVLEKLEGEVRELRLFEETGLHLTPESLLERERCVAAGETDHPMLRRAREFAEADEIVIAAPYWDLMFPAVVRAYLEAVTVSGVTFVYGEDGVPRGLCRAERLIYVTTAGGPVFRNFGFEYVDALARAFYGIGETRCIRAEGLDIWGADTAGILERAKAEIEL